MPRPMILRPPRDEPAEPDVPEALRADDPDLEPEALRASPPALLRDRLPLAPVDPRPLPFPLLELPRLPLALIPPRLLLPVPLPPLLRFGMMILR